MVSNTKSYQAFKAKAKDHPQGQGQGLRLQAQGQGLTSLEIGYVRAKRRKDIALNPRVNKAGSFQNHYPTQPAVKSNSLRRSKAEVLLKFSNFSSILSLYRTYAAETEKKLANLKNVFSY